MCNNRLTLRFLNIDIVGHEYIPPRQPTVTFHDEQASHAGEYALREKFAFHELSVPRRPPWTPGVTTPDELEALENEYFLEWRRGIAKIEEEIAAWAFASHGGGVGGVSVTPYEKNLHVWRQLWRVLERSNVVLQIVDARNPLFYLSEDLRKYSTDELGKPMLILVNKSDYLTQRQRMVWSEYFTRKGVDHLFFSAYEEQKKIDQAAAAAKKGKLLVEEQKIVSDDESDSDGYETPREHNGKMAREENPAQASNEDFLGTTNPLSREQLLDALAAFSDRHG